MSARPSSRVLLAIALFKLIKAACLIALGLGALSLVHDPDTEKTLRHVVGAFRIDPDNRVMHTLIGRISGLDRRRLQVLGVGTFVYAAVFLTEGTGLLLRKLWAEYLTTLVTASFIPFEIYETASHPSLLKAAAIVVNVLIVVFLAVRLRRQPRSSSSSSSTSPPAPSPPT